MDQRMPNVVGVAEVVNQGGVRHAGIARHVDDVEAVQPELGQALLRGIEYQQPGFFGGSAFAGRH